MAAKGLLSLGEQLPLFRALTSAEQKKFSSARVVLLQIVLFDV